MCLAITTQAQTSTGIHHIKYLEINTANSDYSVDFIDEDKVVFATSTANKVVKNKKFQPHLDLFEGEMTEEGQILNKSRNKGIQTKKIIKTGATFSSDKKTVYFSARKYTKRKSRKPVRSDIYKANIDENGVWFNMAKLPFNTGKHTIENPSLNKDGNRLYFSADLPGTLGGKDIFVITINEDGTYSKPRNLGANVNTNQDEITPFIADNHFLYYSSNGKENSLGNFDIYASEAFDNTVSESLHLDSPINSINDDFAYIVKSDKGYFSSNRLQGQDNNDIYSFYIEPDKPEECFQQVLGTVRDKDTEIVLAGVTIDVINDEGLKVDSLISDENGNYKYNLGCRGTFTFRAYKKDYSKEEHIINTANYTEAPSLEVNQSLTYNYKEVEDKVVINVNPIYFGFDKWNINNNAAAELDKIVKIMKENTSLIIESESHTDSRGTKAYNQILSQRRAKATVDYIISKGIDANRINSKGYGESKLLNNCADGVRCKVEDHKMNRRTDFVIKNKQTSSYRRPSSPTIKEDIPAEEEAVIIEETVIDDNKVTEASVSTKAKPIETTKVVASKQVEKSSSIMPNNGVPVVYASSTYEKPKATERMNIVANNTQDKKPTTPKNVETNRNEVVEEDTNDEKRQLQQEATEQLNEDSSSKPELNKEVSLDKAEVPEGSILEKMDMIKDFRNPIIEEDAVQDQEVETQVIYTTAITIVDNTERNQFDPDKEENSLQKNMDTPKNLDKTNNNEEAFTNASSALKKNLNTKHNDQISSNLEKHNTESDTSNNSEVVEKLYANAGKENMGLVDSTMNSEELSKNENITNVSNTLFDDEDDSTESKGLFSNDLSKKITVTDYEKNPKTPSISKNDLIGRQQKKFKKEYVSNVQNLKKEEVLSIKAIDVSPISINKRGKYIETDNWKRVDVMRINFQINNNKYITAGYKEVYILIQNPSGVILNRKGKFKVNNGKELTYTEKTNAYYNNNQLNISMVTDRFIQQTTKGIYTITIYIEGYPVGLEMVELS